MENIDLFLFSLGVPKVLQEDHHSSVDSSGGGAGGDKVAGPFEAAAASLLIIIGYHIRGDIEPIIYKNKIKIKSVYKGKKERQRCAHLHAIEGSLIARVAGASAGAGEQVAAATPRRAPLITLCRSELLPHPLQRRLHLLQRSLHASQLSSGRRRIIALGNELAELLDRLSLLVGHLLQYFLLLHRLRYVGLILLDFALLLNKVHFNYNSYKSRVNLNTSIAFG